MSYFKPTGKCDVCGVNDAKYWFGQTSSALCGRHSCGDAMEEKFKIHCEEMEKESKFEKEMREIYGGDCDF